MRGTCVEPDISPHPVRFPRTYKSTIRLSAKTLAEHSGAGPSVSTAMARLRPSPATPLVSVRRGVGYRLLWPFGPLRKEGAVVPLVNGDPASQPAVLSQLGTSRPRQLIVLPGAHPHEGHPWSEGIDELSDRQPRVADQPPQETSLELAMIGDGQRLALARRISKSKVATALPNDHVSERGKCRGRLSARDPGQPRHSYAPTATLPMSSPVGSGIGSPLARMSSTVRAIASRALEKASSTVSPWL